MLQQCDLKEYFSIPVSWVAQEIRENSNLLAAYETLLSYNFKEALSTLQNIF